MHGINFWHLLYEFRSIIYTLVALIVVSRVLKKFFKTLRKSK